MSDLLPPEPRDFRFFSTLRTLITAPSSSMATIAAARPWAQGSALAIVLVLLNGFVNLLAPINRQLLEDPNLPGFYRPIFTALTSPWWAVTSAFLIFPATAIVSVCICLACGRLLAGRGTFAGLLATQMFTMTPLAFLIPVTLVLNLLRVPVVGGLLVFLVVGWMIILGLIGIRESLGLSTGRAIITMLSPFPVGLLLGICLALGFLPGASRDDRDVSATAARRVPYNAPQPEVRPLAVAVNDLQYDATRRVLYASVPSSDPTYGNRVVAIDPFAGVIGKTITTVNTPSALALSSDNRYLYVGLNGDAAIQRIDLATDTVDLTIPLVDAKGNTYTASTIVIAPDDPKTIVVGQAAKGVSTMVAVETVAVYADGQQRSQVVRRNDIGGNGLFFCDDSATLYGTDGGYQFYTFDFTADGVQLRGNPARIFEEHGSWPNIVCAGGLLYTSQGDVFEPTSGRKMRGFGGAWQEALVCVDESVGQTYVAAISKGERVYRISISDLQTYDPITSLQFPLGLSPQSYSSAPGAQRLVRWGDDGLAFRLGAQLFLVRSPAIAGKPAATTPTTPQGPLTWPFGAPVALAAVARRTRSAADRLPDRSAALRKS
ncbi:MAG: YIP1 family protein [Chloroflexia bacterium]